jgi:hypothetical protein
MAKLYESQKGAMAKYGVKGAITGATTAAQLGGDPRIIAAAAGAGALGGVGLGALAGRPTEYERDRRDALDEMLRRQELGMLGLTDEERRALEAQLIDPLRAQQREAETRRLGSMGIGDIGGGAFAKAALSEQERQDEQLARERQRIAQADVKAANQEEERIREELEKMAAVDQAQRAEDAAAIEEELAGTLDAVMGGAALEGEIGSAKELYDLFGSTSGKAAKPATGITKG